MVEKIGKKHVPVGVVLEVAVGHWRYVFINCIKYFILINSEGLRS